MIGELVLTAMAIVPVPRPVLSGMEPVVAKQLAEARAKLDNAIARDVASATLFGETGRIYHAYAIADAAEACYQNAESLDAGDFRWPYLLAVLQQDDSRLDAAAASLQRALSRPNQYYPAWVRLASVELARGRVDAAAAALERVGEHAPNDPARLLVEGQIAIARHREDQALESLSRALQLQPRATRLHYLIGMAYRALGRLDEARQHLDRAGPIGVRPLDPVVDEVYARRQGANAFLIEGHAAFRAGDYDAAIAAFRRAADAGGETTATALLNLAAAEARLGRDAEAIDHLGRALDFSPGDDRVRLELGLTLLALGRTPQGLGILEAIRAFDAGRCTNTLTALVGLARSSDATIRARALALERRLRNGPCRIDRR